MEPKETSFLNAYRNNIFMPVTTMQEILGLNSAISQILIESKVLEISESDAMRLGLTFGKEAGVFKFITDKDNSKTSKNQR